MPTTPLGYPYYQGSDSPAGAAQVQALAEAVDASPGVSSLTGAAIAALSAPLKRAGRVVWNSTTSRLAVLDGAAAQALAFLQDVVDHAALATGVHGVGAGAVVGTTLTQTLTGKTLDSPDIVGGWHSWGGESNYPKFFAPREVLALSATGATGTINLDALDKTVLLITANATANWTINLRGNASWSLDSSMNVGESVTFLVLATQGATAYYPNTIKVDGTTVTVKWAGGVAPTFGNANSIDAYTLTAIKTAAATFTVLGGQARFA